MPDAGGDAVMRSEAGARLARRVCETDREPGTREGRPEAGQGGGPEAAKPTTQRQAVGKSAARRTVNATKEYASARARGTAGITARSTAECTGPADLAGPACARANGMVASIVRSIVGSLSLIHI